MMAAAAGALRRWCSAAALQHLLIFEHSGDLLATAARAVSVGRKYSEFSEFATWLGSTSPAAIASCCGSRRSLRTRARPAPRRRPEQADAAAEQPIPVDDHVPLETMETSTPPLSSSRAGGGVRGAYAHLLLQQQDADNWQPAGAPAARSLMREQRHGDERGKVHTSSLTRQQQKQQPLQRRPSGWEKGSSGNGSSGDSARGSSAPQRRVRLPSSELAQAIRGCDDLQQLSRLLERQERGSVQSMHIAAAFTAAMHIAAAQPPHAQRLHQQEVLPGLLRLLSQMLLPVMSTTVPRHLEQVVWACSKLSHRDRPLLDALGRAAALKAALLTPRELSRIASAYARMGMPHPQLAAALSRQAGIKARGLEPWALLHTAWALRVLRADGWPLLLELATRVDGPPAEQDVQCSTGRGGSDVRLGQEDRQQQQQQHQQGISLLHGLSPMDIATMLWLLAEDGRDAPPLLDRSVELLKSSVDSYPLPAAAQALLSCAVLGVRDEELARCAAPGILAALLAARAEQGPDELGASITVRHGARAVFALARLGSVPNELLRTAVEMAESVPRPEPSALCMLSWALVLTAQHERAAGDGGIATAEELWPRLAACCGADLARFSADQLASLLRADLRSPRGWRSTGSAAALRRHTVEELAVRLHGLSHSVLAQLLVALGGHALLPHAAAGGSSEAEQLALLDVLAAAADEWLSRDSAMVTSQRAREVARALRGAGLEGQADRVEHHHVDVRRTAGNARRTQDHQVRQERSEWIDRFVANTPAIDAQAV